MKNTASQGLHVPEPTARPGDKVDFSHIVIPAAGSSGRSNTLPASGQSRILWF